jgi:hypothetical protein
MRWYANLLTRLLIISSFLGLPIFVQDRNEKRPSRQNPGGHTALPQLRGTRYP